MANYDIQGSLLEACSCSAPCPCWIGEDPHGGKCDTFLAYRIDKGTIGSVDVGGVAFAIVAQVPGNILKGNWKIAVYMSDKATAPQKQAILDAWTGKLGGPLADLAKLIGEVKGVHDAPVDFRLEKGKGTLKVGQFVDAEMAPYTDANGTPLPWGIRSSARSLGTLRTSRRPRTIGSTSRSTGCSGSSRTGTRSRGTSASPPRDRCLPSRTPSSAGFTPGRWRV